MELLNQSISFTQKVLPQLIEGVKKTISERKDVVILLFLIYILSSSITWNFILQQPSTQNPLIILGGILLFAINMTVSFMIIKFSLDPEKYKAIRWKELLPTSVLHLLGFFIVIFFYAIVTLIGFIFFIIPGVFFATKYFFATYAMVDKSRKIYDAFTESGELTQGKILRLLPIVLLMQIPILISIVFGSIPQISQNQYADFVINLLLVEGLTLPMTIAGGILYQSLKQKRS